VLRLLWTESDGTNKTVFSASYQIVNSSSGSTLYRYFCSNTGPDASTEQAILNGTAATSHIVASDLSDVHAPLVNVDLVKSRIDLTLYSHQTPGEQRASIPEYSYTFSATMRTLGVFIPFVLSDPSPGTKTAGQAFNVTVTAKTPDGSATDTSYAGLKTLLLSGAPSSPNGTAPTSKVTINFVAGVATASIMLVDAVPTSLNVSQGTHRTWSPLPLTVGAGPFAPGPLSFSPCPSDFTQNQTATLQVARILTDADGNTVTTAGPATVSLSATAGTFNTTSVSIPSNTATSGTFTFTNPGTAGTATALTASSAGYGDATCSFTTTPTPSTTTTSTSTTTTTSPSTTTTTVPPPPAPSLLTSSPKNNVVDLTFSDTQAGVTFECQIDNGTFSACTSPTEYKGSKYAGTHTYGVHAVDSAGRVSPTTTKTQAA